MARVRSGQAPAWPLVSDRSARGDTPARAREGGVMGVQRYKLPSGAIRYRARVKWQGRYVARVRT